MKYKLMKYSLMSQMCENQLPFREIGRHIEGDPELAPVRETILRYANSPFFGLTHKVTDTATAIGIVGLKSAKRYIDQEIEKMESAKAA